MLVGGQKRTLGHVSSPDVQGLEMMAGWYSCCRWSLRPWWSKSPLQQLSAGWAVRSRQIYLHLKYLSTHPSNDQKKEEESKGFYIEKTRLLTPGIVFHSKGKTRAFPNDLPALFQRQLRFPAKSRLPPAKKKEKQACSLWRGEPLLGFQHKMTMFLSCSTPESVWQDRVPFFQRLRSVSSLIPTELMPAGPIRAVWLHCQARFGRQFNPFPNPVLFADMKQFFPIRRRQKLWGNKAL